MSLSSKSRKENTESYAAQQMGNTMGVAPELNQLSKTDQPGVVLPSESYRSNDVEANDVVPTEGAEKDETKPYSSDASLVEVSDEALARNEDGGLTGPTWDEDPVPGADWNRDTEESDAEAKSLGHS